MIVVIDYNVGNIESVCNAFHHIGCDVKLSCEPVAIESAAGLVLLGVAAFGYAVNTKLNNPLRWAAEGLKQNWQVKFNRLSKHYTTRWDELSEVA